MNLFHPSDVAAQLSSDFCVRLTQSLLHFLWQGFFIGLVVWLIDRLLPRASSRFRYAAGVAALLVMLVCVPATYFAVEVFSQNAQAAAVGPAPAPIIEASSSTDAIDTTAEVAIVDTQNSDIRSADDAAMVVSAGGISGAPSFWTWQSLQSFPARLAPYATLAYLLGVGIMLTRLSLALRSGQVLRQSATPLADAAILAMAARQARRIGLKIVPVVAWCQRAAVPLVVGIVRPMILLPTAIAGGISPEQLEALLAHELAHLKRLDLVVNLVQRLAESLLFFHPAVWYVSRRISIERENCCDDCVLRVGFGRVEYADALVRMAEVCAAARGLAGLESAALLAASGDHPSQFKRRVLRLLDAQDHLRAGISRGWLLAAVGAVVLAMAILPFATNRKPHAEAAQPQSAREKTEFAPVTQKPDKPAEKPQDSRPKEKLYRRGQDALDRIEKVKPAWSDAQSGVEFGVALIGDKKQFRSGERVPLEMFVRNVGDKALKVQLGAEFLGNVPEVKNERGEVIPIERILATGTVPLYRETLQPGAAFGFRHLGVGLGPNPAPGKQNWHPYWAEPKPGKYTLRHTHEIDIDPADGLIPGKRVKFTSGVVEFEVVDGGDRRPALDDAKRTFQAAQLERQQYLKATFPNDERLIKSEVFVAEQSRTKAEASLEHASAWLPRASSRRYSLRPPRCAETGPGRADDGSNQARSPAEVHQGENAAGAGPKVVDALRRSRPAGAESHRPPLIFVLTIWRSPTRFRSRSTSRKYTPADCRSGLASPWTWQILRCGKYSRSSWPPAAWISTSRKQELPSRPNRSPRPPTARSGQRARPASL
jgi:beta-lactamase regulating signal transducer with metallopeptidase domain